eukprot:TRINITY_DN1187_c2_g1_i1.p1 TRINITY_DN1187_c2_g1~~TRINITY_DN1187_c2_g1_i1.p1  ORF type:complete len:1952 (+),score=341.45 TRINITY_DN1187_c2_g1_i1:184-6039(+)
MTQDLNYVPSRKKVEISPPDAIEEEEEQEMEVKGELIEGVYQRVSLGLAARAAAVQCLNNRFTGNPDLGSSCCGILEDHHPFRHLLLRIVEDKRFEYVNIALIIANAVTLALDAPNHQDNDDLIEFLRVSEIFFLCCFSLEAVIKIAALGLYGHPAAYLRNSWNWLDLSIVLVGIVDISLTESSSSQGANISALRLLRVLRPLRTVSKVRGMSALISTLAFSLPLLADVFLLLTLLMVMFAIIGVQLWSSSLHQRCYDVDTLTLLESTSPCSTLDTGQICSVNNSVCRTDPVYHINNLNYDHIGYALILVFKIVSLDDWPLDLWLVQQTSMHIAWLYFFVLVLVGAYFAVNLFLAVLSSIFTSHEKLEQEDKNKEEAVCKMKAVIAIMRQGTQRSGKTKVLGENQEMHEEMAEATNSEASSSSRSSVRYHHSALIPKTPNADMGMDFSPYSVVLRNKSALLLRNSQATFAHGRTTNTLLQVPSLMAHFDDSDMTTTDGGHERRGTEVDSDTDSDSSEYPELGPLMTRHGCLLGMHQPPTNRVKNREHVFLNDDDGTTVSSGSTPTLPDTPRASPRAAPYGSEDATTEYIEDEDTGDDDDDDDETTDGSRNDDVLDHTINVRQEVAKYGGDTTGSMMEEIFHWDVKIDVMAFNEDRAVYQCDCLEDEEGIENCKTICTEQAFTGFAVLDGIAYFTNKVPSKLRSKLKPRSGVVVFLLSRWKIFPDTDAYHGQNAETIPLRQIAVCRRYCLDKGYGGFAVKGNVVFFRKPNSEECSELLAYRKGIVFYLPNTDIKHISAWRMKLRRLVLNPNFEKFMLGVTIVNVVALAVDYEGIESSVVTSVEIINTVCTALFFFEIVMKIVGLGFRLTFKDAYNRVDALLVAIGVPQTIIFWAGGTDTGNAVSVFRLLRVARILRLGRRWNLLRKTIQIVGGSLGSVAYLSMIVGLVVFIYSVLGMHLFGRERSDSRLNFGTLWRSFLTVFVVITGEGWSRIMTDTMANVGWAASIYFISLFIIGRYIILNLFIAIIIDNFHKEKEAALLSLSTAQQARLFSNAEQTPTDDEDDEDTASPRSNYSESRRLALSPRELRKRSICELHFKEGDEDGNQISQKKAQINTAYFGEKTCKIFASDGVIRKTLTPIVLSDIFDVVMILIITVNLLFLAVDNSATRKNSSASLAFDVAEYAVTALFVIEMLMKIIVFGVWKTPHAYLRDMWNVIDAIVAVFSILGLIVPFFRLFRSARVFRLAIRSTNVKVVLYAAVGSMPSVLNGLVICGFVFVLFGILGVQLFKGVMVQCNDSTIPAKENCTGTFVDANGFNVSRDWKTLDANFNNIGESIWTLLKVGLGEEWVGIMFSTVDASGRDTGPVKDYNEWVILFYVVFIAVASFLCLNLIISILISSFSSYHEARFVQSLGNEDEAYSGWKTDLRRFDIVQHQFLTDEQKRWVRSQQLLVSDITYIPLPEGTLRRHVYTVVEGIHFEWAIAIVIICNLLLLCTQHADESSVYKLTFSILNYIFVGIYVLECGAKMIGYGVAGYFKDPWNRFDFVVLGISITGLVVGASLTVFRVLRMLRVLRLFHMSKGLNKMFSALLYALPPLFNIGLLVLCVFFVFGVTGVDLFGRLDIDLNPYLNRYVNFRNLAEAALLLFQISTGELWIQVMNGCMVSPPFCTNVCAPDDNYGDCKCGTDGAILYFLLFMILVSFLMVNLFVAVVLEAFQDAEDLLSNDQLVQAFKDFRRDWLSLTFDKEHDNNLLKVETLIDLLQDTPPPIGLSATPDAAMLKLLKNLNIPVDVNLMVQYTDVVHALARHVFEINLDQAFELSHLSPVRLSEDSFTAAHFWCVRKILNTWHRHVMKRRDLKADTEATEAPPDVPDPASPSIFTPFTSIAVHVPDKQSGGNDVNHTFLQIEYPIDDPSLSSTAGKRRKSVVPWDKLEASASNLRLTPTKSSSRLE